MSGQVIRLVVRREPAVDENLVDFGERLGNPLKAFIIVPLQIGEDSCRDGQPHIDPLSFSGTWCVRAHTLLVLDRILERGRRRANWNGEPLSCWPCPHGVT